MKQSAAISVAGVLIAAGVSYGAAESAASTGSGAAFLGHPIHPMLVTFPLALFIVSLLLDLIYIWRHDDFWHRSAYYMMLLGFIGGIAAAIPGIVDYALVVPASGEVHETAQIHWILNAIVMALFAINLLVRTRIDTSSGRRLRLVVALSVVGVVIVLVSAWFGGDLVYEDKIGVS